MRVLVRFALCGLIAIGAAACGPKAQEVPPTVPTGPLEDPAAAKPETVPAELPRVPAPAELFVRGRFKNPQVAFDRFTEWTHVPVPLDALRQAAPAFASVLQLDAPADFAATLDPDAFGAPRVLFAVSVGLNDFEHTLSGLRERGRALERISRHAQFLELGDDEKCLVTRSNGPSPARLVCSNERKSLDVLGPYMARTLASEKLGAQDLFVEVEAEPLRKKFGKKAHLLKVGIPMFLREASLNNERFDSALSDAAHAVVDEALLIAEELHSVRFQATLEPKSNVFEVEGRLTFNGARGFVTRDIVANAGDGRVAPELFWQLATGADVATYSSAVSEPQRFDAIAANVAELMNGAREHFGLPQASLTDWVSAFRNLVATRGPSVYAAGRLPESVPAKSPTPEQKLAKAVRDSIGFHVVAVDADEGRLSALVEKSVGVFNDPSLRAFVQKQGSSEVRKLPKIRKGRAPRSAPPGTRAYELTLTGRLLAELTGNSKGFNKVGTLRFHLLTLEQGPRTWLALSTDAEFIAARLKAAQADSPVPVPDRRAGLELLATQRSTSAGFMTLEGLLANGMATAGNSLNPRQVLLAMPHRGRTPILFRSYSTATGPGARIVFRVPRVALEDATAAIVSIASQKLGPVF